MTTLRENIDACLGRLSRFGQVQNGDMVGFMTNRLIDYIYELIPKARWKYPVIAERLEYAVSRLDDRGYINLYAFYEINTVITILSSLEPYNTGKKFFISHSSADEKIVKGFIKEILKIGCGFTDRDIFCTLDSAAIQTGKDFREKIIKNMRECDYILLFISENYNQSEVCKNELGAAWAFEDSKRVLPIKFPNLKFEQMGFLNVVKQGASLTDGRKLDELYNELCKMYSLTPDWLQFNKSKDDFIQLVNETII